MKCEEVINQLDNYLGSELSEIEEFNIKKHMSKCSNCNKECNELKQVFLTLSTHDMVLTPMDFTDNVLSQINVYEKQKNMKEVFLFKGVASIVAAGLITALFNFVQYRPINLFSQIYKSTETINRIVIEPVDRLSTEIKDIADSF